MSGPGRPLGLEGPPALLGTRGRLRRNVVGALLLADLAWERGLGLPGLLAGTGLQALDLDHPGRTLTLEQECGIIHNLLNHCGDEAGLGLEVGRRYRFTQLGPLGLALASSLSLRSAFAAAEHSADLGNSFVRMRTEPAGVGGRDLRVLLTAPIAEPALHRFVVERMVGVVLSMAASLLGRPLVPLMLEFSFGAPVGIGARCAAERYGALGAYRLYFGQPADVILISATDLDQPLQHGNALAFRQAQLQCQRSIDAARWQGDVAARLRDLMLQEPERMGDMRSLAAQLCMSERTLRRRLKDEGTSFLGVCENLRRAQAEQMLSVRRLSIEQIALRLGYAESASFIHAFKRWKGQTPHAYRLRAAGGTGQPARSAMPPADLG